MVATQSTMHGSRFARRALRAVALGTALVALTLACTQNLGGFGRVLFVKPAQNENVGLGFDPGVDLSGANGLVGSTDVAGAVIPGPTGLPARRLAFVGFASDVSAGMLDRDPSPPSDGLGTTDVFVASIRDGRETVDGTPRASVFGQALVNSFRHPRCVTCHGFHTGGFGTGGQHPGGDSSNDNDDCKTCHDADIGASKFGEEIAWVAPLAPPLGPDLSFTTGGQPKSILTLCQQTKANTPDPVEHFENDDKIFWAFESTLAPDGEVTGDGPVPFEKEVYDDLVEAWVQGGCRCETSELVGDVVLASRPGNGANTTANQASRRPSLAFEHNPGFDPDDPDGTNPAGWVIVAYETQATNAVDGATDVNQEPDVVRTRVAVRMDEDVDGMPATGAVNLVAEPTMAELVSAAFGQPLVTANGASEAPSIDAAGELVAFQSRASNLGFTKVNGANDYDVFVRNVTTQTTGLASTPDGTAGGNGTSTAAAISSDGLAVVFQSMADDLDFNDTNGVQDVYWARIDPSATVASQMNLGVFRASVATGGLEGTGGDSSNPSIHVLDPVANDVVVAFESQKTDLAGPLTGLPASNVYLYRGPLGIQTTLVSQINVPGQEALPDGASSGPSISPDGSWLAYETSATNLDVVWPDDENGSTDVVLVDLDALISTGEVAGRRLSMAAEGVSGVDVSDRVRLAGLRTSAGGFDPAPLAAYRTSAENLGAAAHSNQNVVFLSN